LPDISNYIELELTTFSYGYWAVFLAGCVDHFMAVLDVIDRRPIDLIAYCMNECAVVDNYGSLEMLLTQRASVERSWLDFIKIESSRRPPNYGSVRPKCSLQRRQRI